MDANEESVRERLRDSLARIAGRAYERAHGSPVPAEARGIRWRVEPRLAVSVGLVVVLVGLLAWFASRPVGGSAPLASWGPSNAAGGAVIVDVAGSVRSPGVVTLAPGSRVKDAVHAAGGLAGDADASQVNLARKVGDGEQIYLPTIGDPGDGRVNLNRASVSELEDLPGIGSVLAERIVADRERRGSFARIDDLARVSGIGSAVIAQLREMATV